MIPDQKKYINYRNKLLVAVSLDHTQYGDLLDMLAEHFKVFDTASEDEAIELLAKDFNNVVAVLIDAKATDENGFDLLERIESDKRFVEIPVIAISDSCDESLCEKCIANGVNEFLEPPFNKHTLPIRIRNAARAKDSVTFHEMELMLRELPSNIYLKDRNGNYIFSSHYWHHLKAQPQGWTIRGKTEFDIQKNPAVAVKASEADKVMIATQQGVNYILEMNDDGIHEFIQVIKSPTYDSEGNVNGIIAIMNDVTELETLKRRLEDRTEQISAELRVAAQIQASMLPMDFEGHDSVDISASMTPAKNVGGDYYDFFPLDDDHIAFTIADVSGKGVPAALTMTITKIVIHDRALTGGTPAEILYDANERICMNNTMNRFITVWFGILDLRTGIVTYANAGHEYPAIKKRTEATS